MFEYLHKTSIVDFRKFYRSVHSEFELNRYGLDYKLSFAHNIEYLDKNKTYF
jgi:hypothetical protein